MGKRITELEETQLVSTGDFVMLDNDTLGDSKYDLGKKIDSIDQAVTGIQSDIHNINLSLSDVSDEIDNINQSLDDANDDISAASYFSNITGVKNLAKYPYYHTGSSPLEQNGITWTDNGDGTITADGTPSGTSLFLLWSNLDGILPNTEPGKKYILSLEVQGGSCSCSFQYNSSSSVVVEHLLTKVTNTTEEIEFTAPTEGYTANTFSLFIRADHGAQTGTLIKPMLRPAVVSDNTYKQYVDPSIAAIREMFSKMIVMKRYRALDVTIEAGQTAIITGADLGIEAPSGYTLLAIRRFQSSIEKVVISTLMPGASATGSAIRAVNTSDASVTCMFTIDVVYIKNDLYFALST